MPVAPFTVPQSNLLLALLHLRDPATTAEFDETFGFRKVETDVRKVLSERGLLAYRKEGRSFVYELTDAGWLAARQILGTAPPQGLSSRTARILWAVLRDVSAYMERTGTELADIYAVPVPSPEDSPRSVSSSEPADLVIQAYGELGDKPGAWLPLRELRRHLAHLERSALDLALTDLFDKHEIQLMPEENQKALRAEDRDCALWLGGEYKHFMSIEAR
ncbi:hypothetical protein L0U85_08515 [Glycomyces sp. L485]|uniref:hypothetical protein n=1 Tax=Glycomyces sp. L485 TaxID=2909235 RepID=UPI001F4A6AEF|nr:hypothetical protein [Glycomyces sp. L485]MCH7230890.1 hypothetical protein [Glycomyces sp. L485]